MPQRTDMVTATECADSPLPRSGSPPLSAYLEGICHLVQDARCHPQPGPLQPISCSATHPRTPDAASAGAHRSTWTHPPPGNNPKGIQGSASQCRDLKRNRWAYSVGGLAEAGGGGCGRALPQAARIPPSSLNTPSSLLPGVVVVVMEGRPRCQSGKRLGLCPGSSPPPHQKNQSLPVAA